MAEIELRNVSKTFENKRQQIHALKNINLQIEKGDIFGVIGYSGAGKSTLIRLINYLERPTTGQVFIEGKALDTFTPAEMRKQRKYIGMIFQHYNLLETRTVFDNVAIPLVLLKQGKEQIHKRVMELLHYVGLSDKAGSYPKELSGGQKQRVGIARALASNPSILLCDEVTSALDPQTTQSILELLKTINREYKITILLITHEMSAIQQICNRVAVMEKGELIEQGTVLEVFGNPKHSTTQNFVQTVIRTVIPESVSRSLSFEKGQRLYRLRFLGANVSAPIVNELIKAYDIQVNILFADMNEVQDTTLGTMIIRLLGENGQAARAIDFLKAKGIEVQEVTAV